ncbi:HNH endonuclease [Bacteroides clarus YIT 12056]|mgnify:FL=1|uniref:HNH endonuclease domain protein n=1 Tax=Bacteroides clarus YIT 12056 TaxID=762984 RepID=A0ABN0CRY4_9BACE|nr:HNH endonuclease signature motif containing protein [Bacteroides clarus]EGF54248.1 HNH endonuclease domain protein [Bacteroides clarus YIT 12056]SHH07177.1 HNH endonuclease [Bacteroides clarus YIT 12056]
MKTNVNDYTREEECIYKDERYSVRDNGAVWRHPREGKKPRPTDCQWTFGKPNSKTGYMEIGSARVHIIVAMAFYGVKDTKVYVVDHIDTNRQNNRIENLRWLTRLENVLLNPISRKKIEYICGCSAEEFLANPEKYRDMIQSDTGFGWMRTVTKDEGDQCLKNLLKWAASDKQPSGGSMGEWIYQPLSTKHNHIEEISEEPDYTMSLTPGAAQRDWRTPSEFPCTPQMVGDNPLATYAENLKEGIIFSQNQYGASLIITSGFSVDKQDLYVMTESSEGEGAIKRYALAKVTYENGLFIHTGRTFFTKEGAEKQFTIAQGLEWKGGDSIDDYC